MDIDTWAHKFESRELRPYISF